MQLFVTGLAALAVALGAIDVAWAADAGVAAPDKAAAEKQPTEKAAPAAAPAAPAEKLSEEGFVALFNGKDLTGWDGDPRLWSVKDGVIRGETTADKPARGNTFCIWRGGTMADFELRLSFRIQNGNSGVQYRSKDFGNWVVGGYQAEVCNNPYVGFLYDERGSRGSLCGVGEKVAWGKDGKKQVTGSLGASRDIFKTYKSAGWNDCRIIARGNHVIHYLNGVQTIDFTDEDAAKQALSGILALQIHAGDPMVVEFKDIRLKKLEKDASAAKPDDAKPAAKDDAK